MDVKELKILLEDLQDTDPVILYNDNTTCDHYEHLEALGIPGYICSDSSGGIAELEDIVEDNGTRIIKGLILYTSDDVRIKDLPK